MRKHPLLILFICIIGFSSCHIIRGTGLHWAKANELSVQSVKSFSPSTAKKDPIANEPTLIPLSESEKPGLEKAGPVYPFDFSREKQIVPIDTNKMKHPSGSLHKKKPDLTLLRNCNGCIPVLFIALLGSLIYFITGSIAFSLGLALLYVFIFSIFMAILFRLMNEHSSKEYLNKHSKK